MHGDLFPGRLLVASLIATSFLRSSLLCHTSVFLMATAGFRKLEAKALEGLMAGITDVLHSSGFWWVWGTDHSARFWGRG